MLHVVNGESTLATLRHVDLPGEAYSWFDFLMEGPAPDGSEEGWRRRAEWLAGRYGLDAEGFLASQREWQERLAAPHDEIVLWFEGDLFCVFNLAYLLDTVRGNLSLICPLDERLGTLQAPRLAELFEQRDPVGASLIEEGRRAWQALTAGSPASFTGSPAFERAVRLQAMRFGDPSPLEQHIMTLLPGRLGRVARDFFVSDVGAQVGMGDHQLVVLLVGMHRRGLITIEPEPGSPPYKYFMDWQLAIVRE